MELIRTKYSKLPSLEGAGIGIVENLIEEKVQEKHLLLDHAANNSDDFKAMINSFSIVDSSNAIGFDDKKLLGDGK